MLSSTHPSSDPLQGFAAYLAKEDHSPGTIDKYLRDVRRFLHWLDGSTISKECVLAWRTHLQTQGYAAITINGMLAALHSYFNYAGLNHCRVKYLRVQRRLFRDRSRELTRSDYVTLLATARRHGRKTLALIMETLCATGIRVSELPYITLEAVQQGRADIALKGKIRTIFLPYKLCRKLIAYARAKKITRGELFITTDQQSISRYKIWAEMKRLCRLAGIAASKVFPHNLRHLFARTYYETHNDIVRLADVLGHSSIETTRIYLAVSASECARELERLELVV